MRGQSNVRYKTLRLRPGPFEQFLVAFLRWYFRGGELGVGALVVFASGVTRLCKDHIARCSLVYPRYPELFALPQQGKSTVALSAGLRKFQRWVIVQSIFWQASSGDAAGFAHRSL